MPGPWIDFATLKQAVADNLHKPVGNLKPFWDNHVTRALSAGYADIRSRLVSKGYTDAQLDTWDDRVRYNYDQSLFWALVYGANSGEWSDRDVSKLDHRKELESPAMVSISIGGVFVPPGASGSAAPVVSGRLAVETDGVDYGTTFGLRVDRRPGSNIYGDDSGGRW